MGELAQAYKLGGVSFPTPTPTPSVTVLTVAEAAAPRTGVEGWEIETSHLVDLTCLLTRPQQG